MLSRAVVDAAPSALLKGSHLMQAESFIDERLGSGTFRELVAGHGTMAGLLLPGSWYEATSFVQVLRVAAGRLELTLEELTRQVARQNALDDLTSIYRVFLKLAAPHRTLAFTPRLWGLYCRFGEPSIVRNEPGHFAGDVLLLPNELVEWTSGALLGFIPAAIEVAGGRCSDAHIGGHWRTGDTDTLRIEVRYQS